MISQMEITTVRIDAIKRIGQRFRHDLGDIDGLAQSISEIGMLHAIVINENNELICGERRVAAACKLGWSEVPCRILNVSNILRGELDENLQRKDFSPSEVVEIKKAIEATKLRGRPKESEQAADTEPETKGDKLSPFGEGKSRDITSAITGMSQGSISEMEQVVEAAEKEPEKYKPLVEKVDKREISVHKAKEIVESGRSSWQASKTKPEPNLIRYPYEQIGKLEDAIRECRSTGNDLFFEVDKQKRITAVKTQIQDFVKV